MFVVKFVFDDNLFLKRCMMYDAKYVNYTLVYVPPKLSAKIPSKKSFTTNDTPCSWIDIES